MLQLQRDLLASTLASPTNQKPESWHLIDGTQVVLSHPGIVSFHPRGQTQIDLILSCGIHGNETAPIELVNELVTEILNDRLSLKVNLLVILGNPEAMVTGKRELEVNLNRLFNGAHKGAVQPSLEHQRAALIEQQVAHFYGEKTGVRRRYHYDLHTAIRASHYEKFVIYPFRHGRPWKADQLAFLAQSGIQAAVFSHEPTTTFSYYSSHQFDADAFTIELGKVQAFGHNDLSRLDALRASLVALMTQTLNTDKVDWQQMDLFNVARVINRTQTDFRLNFADEQANFTLFEPGQTLAIDGETHHQVADKKEYILFPNAKVAIGQRALLMLHQVDQVSPIA